jgi:hypothetical protein
LAYNGSGTGSSTINSGFTVTDSGSTNTGFAYGGLAYLVQGTGAAINPTWSQADAELLGAIQVAFK